MYDELLNEDELYSKLLDIIGTKVELGRLREYSAYISGARAAIQKFSELFPDLFQGKGKDAPYNRALLTLVLSSKRNTDLFLRGEQTSYRNFVKDKKGKIVSCEAFFFKETIQFKEIK